MYSGRKGMDELEIQNLSALVEGTKGQTALLENYSMKQTVTARPPPF